MGKGGLSGICPLPTPKEPDKERTLPLEPREELPVEEDGNWTWTKKRPRMGNRSVVTFKLGVIDVTSILNYVSFQFYRQFPLAGDADETRLEPQPH
jgi:hypothetical protein